MTDLHHRYIADFYCPSRRLVVEVDGEVHTEEEQRERDAMREILFKKKQLRVLRVRNEEVLGGLPGTLQKIAAMCGMPPSPVPSPRSHREA